jgi:hypothetical protein
MEGDIRMEALDQYPSVPASAARTIATSAIEASVPDHLQHLDPSL